MGRFTKIPVERKRTRDDKLHDEAVVHCGKGVVEQLRRCYAGNPQRTIGSLTKSEIENIGEGAVAWWIVKRVEQYRLLEPEESEDQWILTG